jgi:hypothetical protein
MNEVNQKAPIREAGKSTDRQMEAAENQQRS